ncbi:hypothetical protein K474DRAFT_1667958 [Panus rudis PR-1116 ss-1]|nr:hypothetical protein K474DRAFT_1667958 [Panus rudis PR-1116 ss-1]
MQWLTADRKRQVWGIRRNAWGAPDMEMIETRGIVKDYAPRPRSDSKAVTALFFPVFCAIFDNANENHYTDRCAALNLTIKATTCKLRV